MRNRAAPAREELATLVDLVDDGLRASSAPRRLAGIEALAQLSDLSPAHRPGCLRVLCAAIREEDTEADVEPDAERLRATMFRVLRHRLTDPGSPTGWHGLAVDLSGITVHRADLSGITLAAGSLRLSRSRVPGLLDLSDLTLTGGAGLLLDRITVTGRVDLDRLRLDGGQVVLDNLHLGGGEVRAHDAHLVGGRFLVNDAALAAGRFSLHGAQVCGAGVTFHGTTVGGADLVLDKVRLTSGQCYLTSLMMTAGRLSFQDATLARALLSLRMSTLAGGRLDLSGVQPIEPAEPAEGPDCFEGVYLIPPAQVRWGPWEADARTTLDLRSQDDRSPHPG